MLQWELRRKRKTFLSNLMALKKIVKKTAYALFYKNIPHCSASSLTNILLKLIYSKSKTLETAPWVKRSSQLRILWKCTGSTIWITQCWTSTSSNFWCSRSTANFWSHTMTMRLVLQASCSSSGNLQSTVITRVNSRHRTRQAAKQSKVYSSVKWSKTWSHGLK